MARAKPRSNIYAFLPFLACALMVVGIVFTWVPIQKYRDPDMKPTVKPMTRIPDHLRPPQAKPEEPAVEPPLGEEEEAPGAPLEGGEELAPPGGEEEEGGTVAPPGGGGEEEPEEPEEDER